MPVLEWLNKSEDLKESFLAPYRVLRHVPELGSGEPASENMLIEGDNLHALKTLLPYYGGRVQCIFIDPPYNTRSAFEHYDDNLEHTTWLSMMYPRLDLLRKLLAESGSIWVSIDENEAHYLKVIMDEIFGRKNFVAEIIWEKRTSRENRAAVGSAHDTILVYARMPAKEWKAHRNLLPSNDKGFSNPDGDPNGPWRSIPFSAMGHRKNQMYTIVTPTGKPLDPPKGRCWGAIEEEFQRYRSEGRVYFPKGGNGRPRIKLYSGEEKGLVPMSIWHARDVGTTEDSKKEILALFTGEAPFDTPKPERLMRSIIQIASNPGDFVLDSFLGSGTTAAVAHKMGRRYIGIENGEHARTYCARRLKQVVEGEQGGVSEAVNWRGGGGFSFFTLGDPVFDEYGQINPKVTFDQLAAHVWFTETKAPFMGKATTPYLGEDDGTAYYLLYNGILGDRRPGGGNVLTRQVLADLPAHDGPRVIYGESTRLSSERMLNLGITFKQTPYDLKVR